MTYDVAVLGGGNAGLCAALTAREAGARVVVLESAPRELRGGNSRHTRNFRCMHDAPTDLLTDTYSEDEYAADLVRVTGGDTDEALDATRRAVVGRLSRLDAAAWRPIPIVACAARSISAAPMRSFWAAAKRS